MALPLSAYPVSSRTVQLPYGAWYEDHTVSLQVPETWSIDRLDPDDGPALSPEQIKAAIRCPVGTKTIQEIAKHKRSAVIVVEDITRPTRVDRILPGIIRELKAGGLSEDKIAILFASGAHRPMTQKEIDRKVPPKTRGCMKVHVHDFMGDNVERVGWVAGGPVYLNRLFLKADVRICLGTVLPHNETGFGGGAKSLIPGVAGHQTIAFLHGALPARPRGTLDVPEGNRDRRSWIEAVAKSVGVDVVVCSVVNSERQTAALFIGDLVKAHRAAAKRALAIGRTPIVAGAMDEADCVLANAYPLDTDPTMMSKGISTSKEIGARNTIVVAAMSDGVFYHGMGVGCGIQVRRLTRNLLASFRHPTHAINFLRGACYVRNFRLLVRYAYFGFNHLSYHASLKSQVAPADDMSADYEGSSGGLFVYSPHFPVSGFRQRYAGGSLFRRWGDLCSSVEREIGSRNVRLLVLPCAPLQLPVVTSDR